MVAEGARRRGICLAGFRRFGRNPAEAVSRAASRLWRSAPALGLAPVLEFVFVDFDIEFRNAQLQSFLNVSDGLVVNQRADLFEKKLQQATGGNAADRFVQIFFAITLDRGDRCFLRLLGNFNHGFFVLGKPSGWAAPRESGVEAGGLHWSRIAAVRFPVELAMLMAGARSAQCGERNGLAMAMN